MNFPRKQLKIQGSLDEQNSSSQQKTQIFTKIQQCQFLNDRDQENQSDTSLQENQISNIWTLNSWENKTLFFQHGYKDQNKLKNYQQKLSILPPVVYYQEILQLKKELIECENGEKFILQMGDCAEPFADCQPNIIKNKMKMINLNSKLWEIILGKKVIKMGRLAGQYAKPRSMEYEQISDQKILSFKGEIINGIDVNKREPNPKRLIKAYLHSVATMNMMRQIQENDYQYNYNTMHQFSDFQNQSFIEEINQIIKDNNIKSCSKIQDRIYTSHEGLLLEYEQSLTKKIKEKGYFDLSSHFVWIGNRTRQPNSAHVEFLRGIQNPIGVKIGPQITVSELQYLMKQLNPNNQKGKILIICRMGVQNIEKVLPMIVKEKLEKNYNFIWICDAMHGNTKTLNGLKVRYVEDILKEINLMAKILKDNGQILGGLHMETTPFLVQECIDRNSEDSEVKEINQQNYLTYCDPRLNQYQTLRVVYEVGKYLQQIYDLKK